MSPAILALIMLLIVVIFILFEKQLKVPMNFVLFTVPVIFSFLMGYNLQETSGFILNQLSTLMNQTGYMLLFGLIYFVMLTETGMFDVMVNTVMKWIGNRLNVLGVMILTSVLGGIAYLTANMSTTYLIVFPIVIPLYKKFKINRDFAFIICQTAVAAMCWLPWGIGVVMSATMAGTNAETLAAASIPWGLCFIPAILLQYAYFAWRHKKEHGTLGLPTQDTTVEGEEAAVQEKEFARHDLFWVNFIVFLLVIVALAIFKVPSYMVFVAASMVTAMINYPKNFGQIWNKAGMTFFNVLIMLLAICFYLAIFNAAPEDDSKLSMVASLAQLLESVFPTFLLKYMHIIFLILAVPIIYFVPYQLYNALYPLFISVGAAFGLSPIAVIAPFVCNLALATSVTPMNSATFVGCSLIEKEVTPYTRHAAPIMFVTNLVVILTAIVFGVLHF
ncbi:citrate:H+ symporter [Streptococcus cameli]